MPSLNFVFASARAARHRPRHAAHALALAALAACTATPPVSPAPQGEDEHAPRQPPPAIPSMQRAQQPAAAAGPSAALPVEQRFAQWVAAFRDSARAAGIDEAALHALDGVMYRPRLIEQDRAQPEFTRAIWDYLDAVITPQRVANGQQKLQQYRAEAEAASARYGVPPEILIAIWGVESNFGADYGSIPTLDALATLGFEGRRENWARGELLAALKIVQRHDIEPAQMIGSWAGAMGQTQFMPSTFLSFAVDADGDGRRDIWHSMADVLASTANYLARSGWRADEPWGAEVQLPAGFDMGRADPGLRQSSAQWADEGVHRIDGGALPPMADASILLPAGARGPAFIVGRNHRAILQYNNSMSYALAVSLLAQRIVGAPAVQAAWPRDLLPLSRSQLQSLQTELNRRGFDSGAPDGLIGPGTRKAVKQFQRSIGVPADGYPTLELLKQLMDTGVPGPSPAAGPAPVQ